VFDSRHETLTADAGPAPVRESPAGRLHVVSPAGLVGRIELSDRLVRIGRSSRSADGVLSHPSISRLHAEVGWSGGSHQLADRDSRNGSRVDGRRVSAPVPLSEGGVIRLGDVLAVYERGASVRSGSRSLADALPGRARSMCRLRRVLEQAAPDPAPVLLTGQTGTGKEYVARALHDFGGRRGPFVAVNCAAISPQLVESQLFGHVKGAFTGATTHAPGLFRSAEGGTLLLDEIGDLPLELQPKLLRVIQEGAVTPVGASRAVPVDVRIVAATLHPLVERVEDGRFRRDLYARLALWALHLPPLAERRADIPMWIERLHAGWRAARPAAESRQLTFTADAVERLLLAPWPDNLRGLHRLVHRLAAAGHDDAIGTDDIDGLVPPIPTSTAAAPPEAPRPDKPPKPSAEELEAAFERLGSVRAVAAHYRRERRQIYRWLDAYGLR